jgi:NAD-dependent deacetylase
LSLRDKLSELDKIIQDTDSLVFFGGAGVSTESGIPDFRGEAGQYKAQSVYGHSPEYLISHTAFVRDTKLFYRYYRENLVYCDAKPNKAHLALAKLERKGRLQAIITQNIDGLHQQAGSKNVIELHGSIHRNHCLDCGKSFSLEHIMLADDLPRCDVCGGIVKPDVVLYEEPLDKMALDAATKAVMQANTMIVGGTSLVVYPAAGYVDAFRMSSGTQKKLVIINKDETDKDLLADLVIHDSIGKVLGRYLG